MATSNNYVAPGWAPSGACALKPPISQNTIFASANFRTTSSPTKRVPAHASFKPEAALAASTCKLRCPYCLSRVSLTSRVAPSMKSTSTPSPQSENLCNNFRDKN